ncbi:MAG: ATP-dependent sacrificial sulfur transferase LarE [Dorea sp.]|nr:ATP-dependent sacrificial sulfur transferase LarE [Dorea sp.]MDY2813976.1 ATP-dependent sacrificial sulfur transferase LarE [Dorea sp.]
MDKYEEKCRKLMELLDEYTKEDVLVAFSGGVDSSLLLWLLCACAKVHGTRVYAVTLHTTLHPKADLDVTREAAKAAGAQHKIIYVDELKKAGIEENPEDRCYRCKKYIFTRIMEEAEKAGIHTVLEGTNLEDAKECRPGIQAQEELGIKSPLALAGFTKDEIRRYAREKQIPTADRPSAPCLATRFPYGTRLSYEEMNQVDEIENGIREMGFYNVRARIHGNLVRLEVDEKDILKLFAKKQEVLQLVKAQGYLYATIDMEGFRSGSQDILIK